MKISSFILKCFIASYVDRRQHAFVGLLRKCMYATCSTNPVVYSSNWSCLVSTGPRRATKKCLRSCAKCADSDQSGACANIIRPLLSFNTFCSIQWFCQWTVTALIRLRGCAGWSRPLLSAYAQRHVFAWHGQILISLFEFSLNINVYCKCNQHENMV